MAQWYEEKAWSDRFLPEIKMILGRELMTEAPAIEDMTRATDLIVLRFESVRIACRVRRNKYLAKYRNEFTLRSKVRGKNDTEITKILSGWGDFMFYGFADETETELAAWTLGDLNAFRIWFNRQLVANKGELPCFNKGNSDGTGFMVFKANKIPNFVKSSYDKNVDGFLKDFRAKYRQDKPMIPEKLSRQQSLLA